MYFPYFITYMIVGLVAGVILFGWALKNGQFRDQNRARYLPLEDDPKLPAAAASKISRFETYALLFLVLAGLAATAAVLIFALFFGKQT
jgi:cbb3-type cytochrome oxidase maturation protein